MRHLVICNLSKHYNALRWLKNIANLPSVFGRMFLLVPIYLSKSILYFRILIILWMLGP